MCSGNYSKKYNEVEINLKYFIFVFGFIFENLIKPVNMFELFYKGEVLMRKCLPSVCERRDKNLNFLTDVIDLRSFLVAMRFPSLTYRNLVKKIRNIKLSM